MICPRRPVTGSNVRPGRSCPLRGLTFCQWRRVHQFMLCGSAVPDFCIVGRGAPRTHRFGCVTVSATRSRTRFGPTESVTIQGCSGGRSPGAVTASYCWVLFDSQRRRSAGPSGRTADSRAVECRCTPATVGGGHVEIVTGHAHDADCTAAAARDLDVVVSVTQGHARPAWFPGHCRPR